MPARSRTRPPAPPSPEQEAEALPGPLLTAPDEGDDREELIIEPDLPTEEPGPVPDEQRELTVLEADEAARVQRQEARRARMLAAHTRPEVRTYVVTGKALRVDGVLRQVGEEVPEAKSWLRVDSWVAAGRIAPVPA